MQYSFVFILLQSFRKERMEEVLIPDLKRMEFVCFSPIERFSTLCESLKDKDKEYSSQRIKHILNMLKNDVLNADFPEINELTCLLRQTLSGIVDSQEGKRKRSFGQVISEKAWKMNSDGCKILLKPNLDKTKLIKYKERVREMDKLMRKLQKVNGLLQKRTEMMSIAESNMSKYEFLLTIAKNDKCYMADKIKKRELRARQEKIAKLQQKLNKMIRKDERVKTEYKILMTQEAMIRTHLKMMERSIWDMIRIDLKERINIGLASLKAIIAPSSMKTSSYVLEHIQNMEKDCLVVILNAIDRLSYRYHFTIPQ